LEGTDVDRTDLLLWLAVQEDVEHGDVTSESVVDSDMTGQAIVFGREPFVLSGSEPFRKVFQIVDPSLRVEAFFEDGQRIETDVPAFSIKGRIRSLLTAERTALNLLQRLCGIATLTRQMVNAISGTSCRLLDTRKTTPLWRSLEKLAVRHGGGCNHRFGLSDGVLIKDNHVAAAGSVGEAIQRARLAVPHTLRIEAEVESLDQLEEALEAGADVVLLDNFSTDMLKEAVLRNKGRALLEASGGVTLQTVGAIARAGVDFVSCGALTHSARAIDISMELTGD
jgi:nicotinate-nucleotide pyrophosphorylase (carboxylating)